MTAPPEPSPAGGVRLTLGYSAELAARLAVGASLAVDGVCLTLVEHGAEGCLVEVSPETLRRTTLGARRAGDAVNLEPSLRLGDALGGHWVQGHVDGVTTVVERRDLGDEADPATAGHRELAFALAPEHRAFVVEKGSVTVDGVSLTVAALPGAPGAEDRFTVALVPHTLAATTLGERRVGDRVHLELDVLAKYVARQAVVARASAAAEAPA